MRHREERLSERIRVAGNHSERITQQPNFLATKCLYVTTAEYTLQSYSTNARCIILNFDNSIDNKKLSLFQQDSRILCTFIFYFLRWAAIKKTQIIDFIKKNIVYDKSIIKDLSPRLAETELFLATALDIFLDYMENANVNINMRDVKDASEVSDLQEMLNIGRNSAYNLIRENKIKHFKVGKSIKIPKIYIIEFMQSICANQQTSA